MPNHLESTCGGEAAIPASSLPDIEEAAKLQFTPEHVAIICGVDAEALRSDPAAARCYMRGRLQAQAEVRGAMFQLAKQGSTPAIAQFQTLANDSESDAQTEE